MSSYIYLLQITRDGDDGWTNRVPGSSHEGPHSTGDCFASVAARGNTASGVQQIQVSRASNVKKLSPS